MRSGLLLTISVAVLAGVACAVGASDIGIGGGPVGGGSTGTHTTVSSTGSPAGSTSSTTSSTTASSTSGSCSEMPCKLVSPQCGCPSGQACTFAGGAKTSSCEAAGTAMAGQACSTSNKCAPGTICLSPGMCDTFCATDSDCSAQGGICAVGLGDSMGNPIPNVTLCSNTCDITTNAVCSSFPNGACVLGQEPSGQMRTFTFCTTAGTKGKNQACMNGTDCMAKFDCVTLNGQNVCLQYCYVNGPLPPGCSICGPLADANMNNIYLGNNQVGVCQ